MSSADTFVKVRFNGYPLANYGAAQIFLNSQIFPLNGLQLNSRPQDWPDRIDALDFILLLFILYQVPIPSTSKLLNFIRDPHTFQYNTKGIETILARLVGGGIDQKPMQIQYDEALKPMVTVADGCPGSFGSMMPLITSDMATSIANDFMFKIYYVSLGNDGTERHWCWGFISVLGNINSELPYSYWKQAHGGAPYRVPAIPIPKLMLVTTVPEEEGGAGSTTNTKSYQEVVGNTNTCPMQ